MLQVGWGLLACGLLVLVQCLLGRWLLRWIGLEERGARFPLCAFARVVLGFALGLWGWSTLGTLFGMVLGAGGWCWALVVGVIAWPCGLAVPWLRVDLAEVLASWWRPGGWRNWVGVGVGLLWLVPFGLQTLVPEHDWDSVAYHLPMARQFVGSGLLVADPYLAESSFPGSVHVVYAGLLAVGADGAVMPYNLVGVLAAAALAGAVGGQFFGARVAAWSAMIALSCNLLMELGLDARIDGFSTLAVTGAVFGLLLWVQDTGRVGALWLLGAMLGLALGCKYTGIGFVVLLGLPLLALGAWRGRTGSWRSVARIGMVLPGLLLPSSFWYARNAARFGDPVYPFGGGRVYMAANGALEPYRPAMEAALSTLPGPPDGYMNSDERLDRPTHLLAIWNVLWDPDRYANKPHHWLSWLLFLGLLLPLRRREPWALCLYGVGLGGFLMLCATGHLTRYTLPMVPALAVCAAAVMWSWRARWWLVLVGAGVGATLCTEGVVQCRKLRELAPWSYWSGNESRGEFLARVGYNGVRNTPSVIQFLNRAQAAGALRPSDVCFMIGEAKTFHFESAHLPDSSLDGARWNAELLRHRADYEAIHRSLWERGVRLLWVNHGYLGYEMLATALMDKHPLLDRRFTRFALWHAFRFLEGRAHVVQDQDNLLVYRLHTPRQQ
jgi:hypothetical protein